jgi:dihydroorotate dehydrogenase electron transfer subunit
VAAREFIGTVVGIEPAMGDAVFLTFSCPVELGASARAGRVVLIACRSRTSYDPMLRRSFVLVDAAPNDRTVTILVRPSDRARMWLSEREFGDRLDAVGWVGNEISIRPTSLNLVLVAGSYGAGPLMLLAKQAVANGRNVAFLMGAATEDELLPSARLPASVEYVVATEDGSHGQRGVVTDLLPPFVRWADQVVASGPERMYRPLARVLRGERVGSRPQAAVIIDRQMPCGFGACLGCIVNTRGGRLACCLRGPVFGLDEIVW